MEIQEYWKITTEITKKLSPEIPPIEELYAPIKDKQKLVYIMQDEKSITEYNKILDNYKNNFRRAIESMLSDEYCSTIEAGKEISPAKLKKSMGHLRRIFKEKIAKRFNKLQVKAKDAVKFHTFIKETEEKIGDTLIDTVAVKKLLCITSHEALTRIKSSVRCFKFTYSRGASRYYFSESDINKLVAAEKAQMPARKIAEKIRAVKSEISRLNSVINFFERYGEHDNTDEEIKLKEQHKLLDELEKIKRTLK